MTDTALAEPAVREFPSVSGLTEARGAYGEILGWRQGQETVVAAAQIVELFKPALPETYHHSSKRRSESLNLDLYGYDPHQGVAVIQARQSSWDRKREFGRQHKTYFLCGYNELTHEAFRHPVSWAAVRGSMRTEWFQRSKARSVEVVRAVQKWMWNVTDTQLARGVRQGDVLVVPEPRLKWASDPTGPKNMVLADSHRVTADDVFDEKGQLYALNPRLEHVKDQHLPVALKGWCSVRVAREIHAWNFAIRIGD